MAAQKVSTPLGELRYCFITGLGRQNFDGDGYDYTASIILDKKEAKKFYEETILPYFQENKPAGFKEDEPSNKVMRKQDDGTYMFSFKTKTTFEDDEGNSKRQKIKILNAKLQERELPDGVGIGNGSRGVISGAMTVYGNNKKAGVSLWLKTVQIGKFVPYSGDEGLEEIDGDFDEFGNADFPEETTPKKKKKKKKEKIASDDDE